MSHLDEAISVVQMQVKIYAKYHPLPPHIEQDDLLQEALLRMLKHISKYDPSRGSLRTFLERHTNGAIIDHLRWVGRRSGYSRYRGQSFTLVSLSDRVEGGDEVEKELATHLPDLKAHPEVDYITTRELPALLKIGSKSMSRRDWRVLVLYYWEEKTQKEIGELLGVNESRVSQLHTRAIKRLSNALESMGIVRLSQLIDE